MADRLKTLKIENYEKELARQRMELRNLQLHDPASFSHEYV